MSHGSESHGIPMKLLNKSKQHGNTLKIIAAVLYNRQQYLVPVHDSMIMIFVDSSLLLIVLDRL